MIGSWWGTKLRDQKHLEQDTGNDCDVISGPDFKLREKQSPRSFSYCELFNFLRNGTIVRCL